VMKKSRWIWTLAIVLVAGGLGIGSIAHLTGRVEAQAQALPSTLAWVPEGATMIGHVDLQSVFKSPLGAGWEERMEKHESFRVLDEIRKTTGLDPQSDLKAATFCFARDTKGDEGLARGEQRWGVAIRGTFDSARIVSALKRDGELGEETYKGTTIYLLRSTARGDRALAFGDASTLLLAEPSYLREMLDAGSGRGFSAGSGLVQRWGESAFQGDAFWLAGSPDGVFATGMGSSPGRALPPLEAFSVSGKLDTELHLRGRGKAPDSKAASELANVVRGLVALGRLQQNADSEISAIVDSIGIQQVDDEVEVSVAVPYETLRQLSKRAAEDAEGAEAQPPQK
jgi:hypothetical protein